MNQRPLGISILAVLHALAGTVLICLLLVMAAKFDAAVRVAEAMGQPPAFLALAVILLAAIYLGSAVGMWRGLRWGWWLGAFTYCYAVARALGILLTLGRFGEALGDAAGPPGPAVKKLAVKMVVRIIICSLLFLYFFKPNVMEYFGLAGLGRPKAAAALIAATIATIGLLLLAGWLTN